MNKIIDALRSLGRRFWLLWLGDGITSFGGQLVAFATGVWIYQKTGSTLSFALSMLCSVLPALLVMPFAGAVLDRFNRRSILIVCDCFAALMSSVFLYAVWTEQLQVVHMYMFAAATAVLNAFQDPAYQASMSAILPQDKLTRASGAMSAQQTTMGIVTPALAGFLLGAIGLSGLVALDLITFCIGAPMVWRAFSNLTQASLADDGPSKSVREAVRRAPAIAWRTFSESMAFFVDDTKMMTLLIYSLIQVAMVALASMMAVPLILAQHSPELLGVVMTCGAVGALIGSLLMVVVDTPKRRMKVILVCDVVMTTCVMLLGFGGGIVFYCGVQFVASAAGAIGASCAYALWMNKVPVARHGSVLVVITNTAMLTTSATVLLGALFVSALEAKLATGQGLASQWQQWFDMGKAAAMGLVFVMCGTVGLVLSLGGLAYKPLREM